jgi:4'-phosphopantetheinyl transferase
LIDVYWLEQTEADVPAHEQWLSAGEALRLHEMRFSKRRTDWRVGRWTAKNAVATYLRQPVGVRSLAEIEIIAAPSGAPEVFCANHPADVRISLSHREGTAACALTGSGLALGCDLEIIEPHNEAFLCDYFTAKERCLVIGGVANRDLLSCLVWSAKESALKALQTGLRMDTRCVVVDLDKASFAAGTWNALQVRQIGGQVFSGWWKQEGALVRTVVADPAPSLPVPLQIRTGVEEIQTIREAQSTALLPA